MWRGYGKPVKMALIGGGFVGNPYLIACLRAKEWFKLS